MRGLLVAATVVLLGGTTAVPVSRGAKQKVLSGDRLSTSQGDLIVHPVGHA